ncbi:MAG: NUDIX domain-containing protein [Myxococcales bacterium]|nr:NUDIX domain-containing protein [Myxococcales bacterium]MCB9577110.1 NUDIX domain-containing protein [Polyangiaceae bacterium]
MNVRVAIALVWRDGRLLVSRRRAGAHLAGKLEFPGGKLRPGETAAAAAEREVLEETGVVCRALGQRPPVEFSYPDRTVTLLPIDAEWQSGDGEPREVDDVSWLSPEDLIAEDFPAANAGLIAELKRR